SSDLLAAAGVLVAGAGLKPSAAAKRIELDGERRTVIDGPFAETRELIAGFSIWQVKDMAEALEWARRCPNVSATPSAIELWPFLEVEDLGEFLSAEDLAAPREGDRGTLGAARGRRCNRAGARALLLHDSARGGQFARARPHLLAHRACP